MYRSMSVFAVLMLIGGPAMADQVTGPVLDLTDSKIVVEKNKEKWQIARDKDTKVTGELKKGAKVEIQYRMIATSIEVKDAKAKDAKEAKSPAKK